MFHHVQCYLLVLNLREVSLNRASCNILLISYSVQRNSFYNEALGCNVPGKYLENCIVFNNNPVTLCRLVHYVCADFKVVSNYSMCPVLVITV